MMEETALSFPVPAVEHQPEEETADLQFADMFNLADVQAIQDASAARCTSLRSSFRILRSRTFDKNRKSPAV